MNTQPTALSQQNLHDLFTYDNGNLVWKQRPKEDFSRNQAFLMWNGRYAGNIAGGLHKGIGYHVVRVKNVRHLLHRLIWIFNNGEIPCLYQIDHINGNKLDNTIENLRLATNSENQMNRPSQSNNKSGAKGVCWHKKYNKWVANIRIDKKQKYLGSFDNVIDAKNAYEQAAKLFFGDFAHAALAKAGESK
jgi:hypothetical protein